jgi:hypothetical protein
MECRYWESLRLNTCGQRDFLPKLITEVEIIWRVPQKEASKLRWVREYNAIWYKHQDINKLKDLIAYSVDKDGQLIRVWRDRESDKINYANWDNCPIEAVFPPSISLAQPSFPSLPMVRKLKRID